MQDQNHPNRSVKDRTFQFNYRIMYTGRYSDDKSEELHSIVVKGKRNENSAQSKRHLYKIKKMYTENVIGQYTTNRWSESLIIFSDKYFEKEYKRIEQTKNEPSKLILIKFDQENKRNLWKEIRTYSTKHGTKIINDGNEQNIIYYTESFVKTQQTLLMFRLLSKVFILTALFLNSIFIMEIKVESEIPSYKKKQEFLRCMGMHFLQMFGINVRRLETFPIISPFLYMSDRRTEQSWTVFLSDGEQSNLTIELNKFLNDQFFNISTTAFTSIMPCLFQLIRALDQRLAFAG